MPGNPLSTFTVNEEQAGRPYDEQAPSGERWGAMPVTAAPKAVFDASNGPIQTNGYLVNTDGDTSTKFAIEQFGGEPAANITYSQRDRLGGDGGAQKINWNIAIPVPHFYEYMRIYQPNNYYHRAVFELESTDTSVTDLWQAGDTVTSSRGGETTIYQVGGIPERSTNPIWINANDFTPNSWLGGTTVTNQRTGTSIVVNDAWSNGANNKFSIWWVDDGDGNKGYSNGAANIELDSPRDGSGNSVLKVIMEGTSYSDDYEAEGLKGQTIQNQSGTLGTEIAGMDNQPVIFDLKNNGSYIGIVIERKRATEQDQNSGEIRVWIMTEGPNGDYPQWTKIFQKTGIGSGMYDINKTVGNNFSNGSNFGPANSGFGEDTVLGLSDHQFWLQKPTFLVDAGV